MEKLGSGTELKPSAAHTRQICGRSVAAASRWFRSAVLWVSDGNRQNGPGKGEVSGQRRYGLACRHFIDPARREGCHDTAIHKAGRYMLKPLLRRNPTHKLLSPSYCALGLSYKLSK